VHGVSLIKQEPNPLSLLYIYKPFLKVT